MKPNFLYQHKILKLRLLFIATVIAFALPANISYGDIVVELLAVGTAKYPTIQAYVMVVDEETGDPITDLDKSNFSIFEDNKPQTVKSAILIEVPDEPVAIALPLDYSGSMVQEDAIEPMKAGAKLLIDELRTAYEDAGEIIKFDLVVKVEQPFTTDKQALIDAVNKYWKTEWGGTMLYDALYKAVEDTVSYIGSQTILGSVVVISDGKDYSMYGPGSEHSLDEVISLADSNDIRIFAVGLGDVEEEVLIRMANETGGGYFYAPDPNDFETIFRAIVTEHFGGGYIVSYDTSAKGCKYHELRIVVTKTPEVGEDTKTFLICPSNGGGDYGFLIFGDGGGGCSMSNPEGQINISHPIILVGIFALGLLVWRKRRRR